MPMTKRRDTAFDNLAHHVDEILNAHGILRAVDEDAWCWQLGNYRVALGEDNTDRGYPVALFSLATEPNGQRSWRRDLATDRYVESPAAAEQLASAIERRLSTGT